MAWLSRSEVDFGIEADPPLDDDDPKLNRFILECFWLILTCAEGRVVVVVNAEAPIANNKMEQNFIVKTLPILYGNIIIQRKIFGNKMKEEGIAE